MKRELKMKKYMGFTLFLICVMLAGCNGNAYTNRTEQIFPQKPPDDYTVEQAIEDGCVIYEDGDIAYGKEIWDAFVQTASAGKEDSVQLGFYLTLGDPSQYHPDYYESIKDKYPLLYIEDLAYDGTAYIIRWFEDDNETIKTYQYLMKYEGDAESPDAIYNSYVRYVLTNDNSVTWEDILGGMLSSQSGAYIDYHEVYTDLI